MRSRYTQQQMESVPRIVAADAGFYSQANEKRLEEMGVKNVSVPNRNTRSEQRRLHQKKRSFRQGQRWRTGCEGRISVLKRRHGLNRCLYRGQDGMKRWVGLGVIADNLINMGLPGELRAGKAPKAKQQNHKTRARVCNRERNISAGRFAAYTKQALA